MILHYKIDKSSTFKRALSKMQNFLFFESDDGDDFATENFKKSAFLAESTNYGICRDL